MTADIKASCRKTTRPVSILVQIGADGPEEFLEVNALEDKLKLTPLSQCGNPYTTPADITVDPTVRTTPTGFFFQVLDSKESSR